MQRLEVWLGLVLLAGAGSLAYAASADGAPDPRVEEAVVMLHRDRADDLALTKQVTARASSQALRELGARQARDHEAADDRLLQYARTAGIPEERLTTDERTDLRWANLATMPRGAALDAALASALVAQHQADVDRARTAQLMTSDPELRTVIGQTLPVLRAQLAASQIVEKSVSSPAGTPPAPGSSGAAAASVSVTPPLPPPDVR